MTLDHVAKFMYFNEISLQIANILEIFGRLGFPLFILLLVEGVKHTSNFGKYALRLGILAAVILAGQIVIHHGFMDIYGFYSPIIDLLLCAVILYLLKQNNRKSFWAILPIAYIILSFIVMSIEDQRGIEIWWFPFYLRSGYNIFALLLSLGFFYSYPIAKTMLKNFGNASENLEGTPYERLLVNTLMCFALLLAVVLVYLIGLLPGGDIYNIAHEAYAMCAVIFIFFYSGELGYNKKWFKYGAYVYFPLHIIIIFLVFLFI